jgi:hypothetical protein
MGDEKKNAVVNWVADMISKLGFPIMITGYLLYERGTAIKEQNETLAKLTETITHNSEVVQQLMQALQ